MVNTLETAEALVEELEAAGVGEVEETSKTVEKVEEETPAAYVAPWEPRPEQLVIPQLSPDDKGAIIANQVQMVQELLVNLLEIITAREKNGRVPYNLWSKAIEPARDAEILLKGIVTMLKTRNSARY